MDPETSTTPKPAETSQRSFFRWLPWEKLSIWFLFLFLVYTLREFFLVIFLTFIFSYIMTNAVRSVLRVASPGRERPWLRRLLVVLAFACLLGSLYGLVYFLWDPFKEQIDRVEVQIAKLELRPETIWDDLARATIGQFNYKRRYEGGLQEQERRERELADYRKEHYLADFRRTDEDTESTFEAYYRKQKGEEKPAPELYDDLRDWIREFNAPDIYRAEEQKWNEEFKKYYVNRHGLDVPFNEEPSYLELQKDEEMFKAEREKWVLSSIASHEFNERREKHLSSFRVWLGDQELRKLQASEEDYKTELGKFYSNEAELPFEDYWRLRVALKESEEEFEKVLKSTANVDITATFEKQTKQRLADETLAEWKFLQLDQLKSQIGERIPQVAGTLRQWALSSVKVITYFALSLLLSFFIAFDLPRIKKGIQILETSKVRDLYREIAPGLGAFGSLIGRAFQAQGVIAICNTLLTLGLIEILEIDYEIFLCTIVFLCSFIPVLGVVLSTVPIALVALTQTGGFFLGDEPWLRALCAVAGVLIIHFIETSILNPKILGEMLHLHPVLVLGILVVGEHFFQVWGLLLGVPVMVYIIRYVILDAPVLSPAASARISRISRVSPASTGEERKKRGAAAAAGSGEEPVAAGAKEGQKD